jgi:hypothetical protein
MHIATAPVMNVTSMNTSRAVPLSILNTLDIIAAEILSVHVACKKCMITYSKLVQDDAELPGPSSLHPIRPDSAAARRDPAPCSHCQRHSGLQPPESLLLAQL